MESIIWIVIIIAIAVLRGEAKKRAQQGNKNQQQNPQAVNRSHRTPPARTPRTTTSLSEAKAKVNRALAGMTDEDTASQPTRIEKRRVEQQATADKSRIHQNLHEKEQQELEAKMKQAMEHHPERFAFEDTDLMAEVQDLMVCGYPSRKSGQRDFIAEGTDFLNRISTGGIYD